MRDSRPTSHLRAWRRIALLGLGSVLAGAVQASARGLGRFAPEAGSRLQRRVTRLWARGVARVIGMRVRIEGVPPTAPRLLVANHLSYVDVVALWTATDGAFVAKSEVAGWPLVGTLGRLAGTLFIDRRRKRDVLRMVGRMDAVLRAGESVIVFAEGTSTRGAGVLPFKSSLFEAALRAGLPVRCASIRYATPHGAPTADWAVCWWGDMTFADHLYRLLALPGFHATLRFAAADLARPERKALARDAREAVCALFEPVAQSEAA